jgi:hypothetical protein
LPLTSGRTDGALNARRWRGFGLTIASPIAIPGALPCDEPAAPVDLLVAFGPAPAPPGVTEQPPYRSADNWLQLVVPSIGKFTLIAGRKLIVTPADEASEADICAMLVASGLPMALWANGGLLLHASAAVPAGGGAALGIAGPSGTGKSLLLHRLVRGGALSLADDSLWLRQARAGFSGAGLPGGGYVRSPAERTRRFVRFGAAQCRDAAPLGALVFLTPPSGGDPLLPLRGQAAMAAVLRQRHRPAAARLLGREAGAFELAALLCRQVPMYALGFDPGDPEPAFAALQTLLCAGGPHDCEGVT